MNTLYPDSGSNASVSEHPATCGDSEDNDGMPKLRETLAKNLKRLMDASSDAKLQEDLEARPGVSQSTISRILLCQAATNVDVLEALARGLRVQPWELLVDTKATREQAFKRILGEPE